VIDLNLIVLLVFVIVIAAIFWTVLTDAEDPDPRDENQGRGARHE
jgi:hypothetical protein